MTVLRTVDEESGVAIRKLQVWRLVAGFVLAVGVALMAMMIVTEGEPGLIPLVLVLGGGAGVLITQRRIRARRRRA